ncbi:MAG: cell division protein ZapB [Treponema sp.]|jgi:acetyl-CoA carboxylase alpha subunit|nr:cell division protein ZapB [Treponema sp.]
MGTLDHVKLLETKVISALDFVKRITEENSRLKELAQTQKKQIEELNQVIQRYKDEDAQIEERILSALNQLNQVEDAMEDRLSQVLTTTDPAALGTGDYEAPPPHDDTTHADQAAHQS